MAAQLARLAQLWQLQSKQPELLTEKAQMAVAMKAAKMLTRRLRPAAWDVLSTAYIRRFQSPRRWQSKRKL